MTAKTHTVGGYVAGAGTLLVLKNTGLIEESFTLAGTLTAALSLYTASTSAILADVDEIRSRAGRKLLLLSVPFLLFSLIGKITNSQTLKHRGITHFLITWTITSLIIVTPCLAMLINSDSRVNIICFAALFFPIGYLSHILLDLLSGKIKLFYPIIKKSIGIMLIPRDSLREFLFRTLLILTAAVLTMQFF